MWSKQTSESTDLGRVAAPSKLRSTSPQDSRRGVRGEQGGAVVTMALAMGVGPLLLYGLTAMSPLVLSELGLSRTQLGSVATTTFLAAAVSSSLVGGLVDRVRERTTMYVLYGGSGLALIVGAAAQSYPWLLGAVVISGAAQALSNPVTNRLISGYPGAALRGTLMGVKQAGVQMAQAFAGLVMPVLALVAGWRGALMLGAVLAMVGLGLSAMFTPDTRTATAELGRTRSKAARMPAAVWWLAAYAFLSGSALQATNVYLPLYGYEALGLPMTSAGALAAVVGGVGLVARIVWGRAVGRIEAPRTALLLLALGAVVGVGTILSAELTAPGLVWVGSAIFGATGIAANVVLMVTVLRVVPADLIGRASGTLALGLYLGFAVGPVTFGGLVDATDSYRIGWTVTVAIYLVTGLLVLLRRNWSPPPSTPSPLT